MKENYLSPDCQNKRFVYGVRIWLKDGHQPMADLAFGEGGRPNGEVITIDWDDVLEREKYIINAYTFIWDERVRQYANTQFRDYVKTGHL